MPSISYARRGSCQPPVHPRAPQTILLCARLIPITKKDGGIRPIAIGTIFHNLISSAIMCNLKEKLPGTFSPVQFGVGMPGGAENIVHGIRNLLNETIKIGYWSPWTLQWIQLCQQSCILWASTRQVPFIIPCVWQSLTMWNVIYHIGMPEKMSGVISSHQ